MRNGRKILYYDLEKMMSLPCQYLSKCAAVLEELLGLTPPQSSDYALLANSLEKMTQINNEAKSATLTVSPPLEVLILRMPIQLLVATWRQRHPLHSLMKLREDTSNKVNYSFSLDLISIGAVLLCVDTSNTEKMKENENLKGVKFSQFLTIYCFVFTDILLTTKEEISSKEKLGMALVSNWLTELGLIKVPLQRKGNYVYSIDDLINFPHLKVCSLFVCRSTYILVSI